MRTVRLKTEEALALLHAADYALEHDDEGLLCSEPEVEARARALEDACSAIRDGRGDPGDTEELQLKVRYLSALVHPAVDLIRPDGGLDLNRAELILSMHRLHDLNMAERVLAALRDA